MATAMTDPVSLLGCLQRDDRRRGSQAGQTHCASVEELLRHGILARRRPIVSAPVATLHEFAA